MRLKKFGRIATLVISSFALTTNAHASENDQPATIPPKSEQPRPTDPAPLEAEAVPLTVAYTPGEGATVKLLNGTGVLNLFGSFSTLAIGSTKRVFPSGGPLLLLPDLDINNTNAFTLHARQTLFGLNYKGPELMGFTPGAFFLGYIQNDNLTADAYGFLPFNAYGELRNDEWRFAAGLQSDVFNPRNPTVNSLTVMFTSGNTGSFRGQARLEHFFKPSDEFQLTTQLALSDPISTVVTDNRRIIEDNGLPNLETRVAAGLGSIQELAGGRKLRPFEVGVSGLFGQLRNSAILPGILVPPQGTRSVIDVWGLGADMLAAITSRCGVSGEFFIGQGLGEYNGGIGQTFGRNLQAIRTSGGFVEGYVYVTDSLHLHGGYGIDQPMDGDLTALQIKRNQTYFANLIYDFNKSVSVSFEVNYRKTDFAVLPGADGMVFYSQFLVRF